MMNVAAFLVPTLALLLAPGPTNALVTLAAAQSGQRRIQGFIAAAALAGYLGAVVPLAMLGVQIVARWPGAPALFRLAGAAWLIVVAAALWRRPMAAEPGRTATDRDTGKVTAGAVFLTTLTNPKALVIALVLLPAPADPRFLAHLALFAAGVIGSALAWGLFGSALGAGPGGARRAGLLGRAASVWLALVSATLATATLTA